MTKYFDSLFFYFESDATVESLRYILGYDSGVFRGASSLLRYRILTESKLTDRSI